MRSTSTARRRPRLLIGLATILAVLSGLLVSANPGAAANTTPDPTGVTLTLSTDNTSLSGGEFPFVLAKAGDTINARLSVDPAGATFNTKVAFNLGVTLFTGGLPAGKLSPSSVTLPGGQTYVDFTVTYSAVDNGVIVTPAPAKANGPAAGLVMTAARPFDSLITLRKENQGTTGFGADTCNSKSTSGSCGVVVLPNGITSPQAALSTGACTLDINCRPGTNVVQFIADLTGLYSLQNPATVIFQCDKSVCNGKGVTSYSLNYNFLARNYDPNANEQLVPALACLTKGQANSDDTACVDYTRSHRDNAGDLLLYLNFTHDIRITGG